MYCVHQAFNIFLFFFYFLHGKHCNILTKAALTTFTGVEDRVFTVKRRTLYRSALHFPMLQTEKNTILHYSFREYFNEQYPNKVCSILVPCNFEMLKRPSQYGSVLTIGGVVMSSNFIQASSLKCNLLRFVNPACQILSVRLDQFAYYISCKKFCVTTLPFKIF